jgi:hypothetical protein
MKIAATLLALLFTIAGSASTASAADTHEVTFGHTSGGPAPTVVFVTLRSTGEIILNNSSEPLTAQVNRAAANQLISLMHGKRMRAVLEELRATGYHAGCCDQEDLYIKTADGATEAAVRRDGQLAIPRELLDALRRVDRLTRNAFGSRHSYLLAPRTR